MEEELLTIDEVSRMLKLAKNTVYHLISSKRIPYIKLSPRVVRFSQAEILAWIKQKAVIVTTEPRQQRRKLQNERQKKSGCQSKGRIENLVERVKSEVLREYPV